MTVSWHGLLNCREIYQNISFSLNYCNKCFFLMLIRMGSDEMTSDLPPLQMTPQASVIPNVDSLIGDLLDINPPMAQQPSMMVPSASLAASSGPSQSSAIMDLLGDGLDTFVSVFFLVSAGKNISQNLLNYCGIYVRY